MGRGGGGAKGCFEGHKKDMSGRVHYLHARTSLPIGLQKCWGRRRPLWNLMNVKNKTSFFSSFSHVSIFSFFSFGSWGGGSPRYSAVKRGTVCTLCCGQ